MTLGKDLEDKLKFFLGDDNKAQYELICELCSDELGQKHLFESWIKEGDNAYGIRALGDQLELLDKSYPGGLREYILKAKKLLNDSKNNVNPLDGWTPSVPQGESYELGTEAYTKTEKRGIKQMGHIGFVLVAGGLGERLGYNGAKVGLPTESTTSCSYLQYYCEYIKAVEKKCADKGSRLPLCIMVSNDTKRHTLRLLKENRCFGLRRRQIFVVEQGGGVPALMDTDARIATEPEKYKIVTKPHGHGDIHALLYKEGITKKWEEEFGVKYIIMFQDTNGLAFHSLPLMLGVSEKRGFIMNSLAIPRKAKQAIGGIARLTSKDGTERTINVEYNQLDPLLRSTSKFKSGDVNDKSGYSPFPGNINQLLFKLKEYNKILERTQGIMPDFVNPKYSDTDRTVFKKPTRLECMMQDFPTVMNEAESKKVGFTQVPAELCFSPVKNSVAEGRALQAKGIAAGTAATGEADQYAAARIMLRAHGCKIEDAPEVEWNGIKVIPGPAIVLKPDFVCCPGELNLKFPNPEKVKISARSTLVVRGPGVVIESLDLDGALILDVDRGEEAIVRDLKIENDGWVMIPAEDTDPEVVQMRGYKIDRRDARYVEVRAKEEGAEEDDDNSDDGSEYIIEEVHGCGGLYPTKSNEEIVQETQGGGCTVM